MRRRPGMWILLLCAMAACVVALPRIPQKPAVQPDFRVPRENARSLDENWLFVSLLYDASVSRPDLWGAVPVGFAKAPQSRAFIAALHTVFRTLDGGRSWTNLDPQPPPSPVSPFLSVRSPNFLSDIHWRPVRRLDISSDSLYLGVYNAATDTGIVRMIRGSGQIHVMWPETLLIVEDWITGVAAPDSNTCVALSGLDAHIFRNDSMRTSTHWDTLPYEFNDTWVGEVTTAGNFIYACGSNFWLSLDRGFSWQTLPSADAQGDLDVDFAPNSARALASGGRMEPQSGWVRFTTDFGQTWSDRTLQTDVPVNCVLLINDTLGYAAGGIVEQAIGRVWRTSDGGQSWELEIEVEAEITELGYARESGGYINVIAAGYFADFRGGVWRSHVQYPDSIGPALIFSQDTMVFFAPAGETHTLEVEMINVGDENITVTSWLDSGPFIVDCCDQDVLIFPGDSATVSVTFAPGVDSSYTNALRVLTDRGEYQEVVAVGTTSTSTNPRTILPQELSLSVYPNPGNAEFRLSYSLTRSSDVALKVFDVTGRKVATLLDEMRGAGEHVVNWSANNQPSGVYFAVLDAGDASTVTKLVLMK